MSAAEVNQAASNDRYALLDGELLPALRDYQTAMAAADDARQRFTAAKTRFYQAVPPLSEQQHSWLFDHTALARLTPHGVSTAILQHPHLAHHVDDVVAEAELLRAPSHVSWRG